MGWAHRTVEQRWVCVLHESQGEGEAVFPRSPAVDGSHGIAPKATFADPEALASVLDQMPVSIVLVDGSARVVWMNLSARLLIRNGDGIAVRDGRLVATSGEPGDLLSSLVRRALGAGEVEPARDPAATMVSRSSGSSPLVVVVRPLEAPGGRDAERTVQAVIFVSDPDHGLRTSRERLRQLFELTRSEAELVALLAAGYGVREAAMQLGVTQETARTYVKRAFQKTGVRRQAELVRLALAAATAGAIDA